MPEEIQRTTTLAAQTGTSAMRHLLVESADLHLFL